MYDGLNNFSGIILDDLSDHLPIFLTIGNIEAPKVSDHLIKRIRQINNANIDILKTKVGEVD